MAYGSENIRRVYNGSPLWIKNVVSSLYGYVQRKDRYGRYFQEYYELLKTSQNHSNAALAEYQSEKCLEFVNDAVANCSFYKQSELYGEIPRLSDLKKFPILTKSTVRTDPKGFYHADLSRIKHRIAHTSGTTGQALVFPLSIECFQREYAFRAMHYDWGNVSLANRDRIAMCAGHPVAHCDDEKPPFWVYDHANHWLLFSSYHMSDRNLSHYVAELESFDPLLLHGYPSSLYLLAQAYKKYGKSKLKLRAVYSASETLLDFQRKAIEDCFNVKVYNWYGNSEMCANIVECEKGELHLKYEHSYVEILNDAGEDCKPGETGRLICTGFGNRAFPLIRYQVGDLVTISKNQQSLCGRGGLLIDNVQGRMEDYIVTPEGKIVGRLDHIFKDAVNVVEAQLIQNDVDHLIVKMVVSDKYAKEDENNIMKEARTRLGSHINIKFEIVNSIPRSANGKFKFILSTLDQNAILANIH